MTISDHFNSYRAALNKDNLPGCGEYALHSYPFLGHPYPNMHAFLKAILTRIATLEAKDADVYWSLLKQHQQGVLSLFGRMAGDHLCALTNLDPPEKVSNLLTFIEEKGWPYYRFSAHIISMHMTIRGTRFHIIVLPNYIEENVRKALAVASDGSPRVTLDAEEMALLLRVGGPEMIYEFLKGKADRLCEEKILGSNAGTSLTLMKYPIATLNSELLVRDWVLPLWGKNGNRKHVQRLCDLRGEADGEQVQSSEGF
ncbi:MAG: hypothetical protein MUP21_13430 [Dehalococcoidia bacterium]|nr:hypothetical protein [Dehalococcoidia bacterium]